MSIPKLEDLPEQALSAARFVAGRLRANGQRGWIVGGAVRDLALGLPAQDVDMATAATPDVIEALFETAHPVGRAFGTIVVRAGALDVQLTTFRKESGYRDARRPDRVDFGVSLEEDARRRDFTCNALYLDPLSGEVADPEGGLADLEKGLLRCVGQPELRFREDGLRLLRLARLAARFGLEVEASTARAARAERDKLEGVSAERILSELTRMLEGPAAHRALELLAASDLLTQALPTWEPERDREGERLRALRACVDPPGASLGFTLLLGGIPEATGFARPQHECVARLRELRASRELMREVAAIDRGVAELHELRTRTKLEPGDRARTLRVLRESTAPLARSALRAWYGTLGLEAPGLALVDRLDAETPHEGRSPEPLLSSDDLLEAGVARGPRLGEILRALEDEQLEGRLVDRETALAWLAARLG